MSRSSLSLGDQLQLEPSFRRCATHHSPLSAVSKCVCVYVCVCVCVMCVCICICVCAQVPPSLLTVAAHSAIEKFVEKLSPDQPEQQTDLYSSLLFNYRIWSRADYSVQLSQ